MSSTSRDDEARSQEPQPARNTTAHDGRPDKQTRFQRGRSRNPEGRPKAAKGRRQIVTEIALETHNVIEFGKP